MQRVNDYLLMTPFSDDTSFFSQIKQPNKQNKQQPSTITRTQQTNKQTNFNLERKKLEKI